VIVRRLIRPFLLYLLFVLICIATYMRLEHLTFVDALFWMAHPHALDYNRVRIGSNYFLLLVAADVFALGSCLRKESC
jgi:hypothetical protein